MQSPHSMRGECNSRGSESGFLPRIKSLDQKFRCLSDPCSTFPAQDFVRRKTLVSSKRVSRGSEKSVTCHKVFSAHLGSQRIFGATALESFRRLNEILRRSRCVIKVFGTWSSFSSHHWKSVFSAHQSRSRFSAPAAEPL